MSGEMFIGAGLVGAGMLGYAIKEFAVSGGKNDQIGRASCRERL